jgi:hypothetical protein
MADPTSTEKRDSITMEKYDCVVVGAGKFAPFLLLYFSPLSPLLCADGADDTPTGGYGDAY